MKHRSRCWLVVHAPSHRQEHLPTPGIPLRAETSLRHCTRCRHGACRYPLAQAIVMGAGRAGETVEGVPLLRRLRCSSHIAGSGSRGFDDLDWFCRSRGVYRAAVQGKDTLAHYLPRNGCAIVRLQASKVIFGDAGALWRHPLAVVSARHTLTTPIYLRLAVRSASDKLCKASITHWSRSQRLQTWVT